MVDSKVGTPTDGPVSAFAKRKAAVKYVVETPAEITSRTNEPARTTKAATNAFKPLKRQKAVRLPRPPAPGYYESRNRAAYTDTQRRDARSSGESEGDNLEEPSSDSKSVENSPPIAKNLTESEHSSSDSECLAKSDVPNQQLSTFVPSKTNTVHNTATEWTVRLEELDSLVLIGQFDVWVYIGAISVLGATLHASSKLHRFYAPSTHSLPVIKQKRNPYGPESQPAEITISSSSTRMRLLKRLSPRFGRVWNHRKTSVQGNIAPPNQRLRSFSFLSSSADDPHGRSLSVVQTLPDWGAVISVLLSNEKEAPKRAMICGPKGSGKSTFCRLLINSFLSKRFATTQARDTKSQTAEIALLDLDPGQPEFTPPGDISLIYLRSFIFGPPFTHPKVSSESGDRFIQTHHIGATSPKDDPDHYLRCVNDLLQHYQTILASGAVCPLVINCSGWVQGSGLEILQKLVETTKPTDVIYMSREGPEEVVEAISETTSKAGMPLHLLSSQIVKLNTPTAADLRMMQTLSYFHLEDSERGQLQWNPSTISRMEPLTVSYGGPARAIFGILVLGEELDPEYLIDVLDGSIVGVVVVEDDLAFPESTTGSSYPNGRERSRQETTVSEDEDAGSLNSWEDDDFDRSEQGTCQPSPHPPGPFTKTDPVQAELLRRELAADRWLISRTENEDLPYLRARSGTCQPLNPTHSRSIGQAFVRSINPSEKTLDLVTPISQIELDHYRQKNKKVILVRGKLDTPTWAYQEDCAAAISATKRKKPSDKEDKDTYAEDLNIRAWASGTSWVKVVDGKGGRQQRDRVWKIRRNLKNSGSKQGTNE